MKTRMLYLAGTFACLCAGLVSAADSQGNFAIWGVGGRSCNQFAQSAQDVTQTTSFRDYLMGYLTAFNSLAPETYDATGGEALETTLAWLREYCDAHKMDSFDRAVGQMLLARHDQRSRIPPSASRGWGGGKSPPASP